MAHITPPEPAIDLYETGFDPEIDLLDRAATGKSLSDLVMRIDDPLVIALDGGWGSGKSFFLKCWVGAHLKDHEDTSQTVYFDAFEHDFIDAPLASLMGVLAERLEPAEGAEKKTGKTVAKATLTAFRKAALPLTRLGLAVATYGATEAAGALADSFITQASKEFEKAAEDFWARESGQRAAMAQFKDVLKSVTEGEDGPKKLIIVIDELDRCRPDYALSLLEIIKHFFAVPNVHFVLGVNMAQLENSVHARYGAGIDAGLYLQKFVGLTMRLPELARHNARLNKTRQFFGQIAERAGLRRDFIDTAMNTMDLYKNTSHATLRGAQRFLAVLQLSDFKSHYFCSDDPQYTVAYSLALLKAWRPLIFDKARKGDIEIIDIKRAFKVVSKATERSDYFGSKVYEHWLYFLDPAQHLERSGNPHQRVIPTKAERMRDLQRLIQDHLETFTLPEPDP